MDRRGGRVLDRISVNPLRVDQDRLLARARARGCDCAARGSARRVGGSRYASRRAGCAATRSRSGSADTVRRRRIEAPQRRPPLAQRSTSGRNFVSKSTSDIHPSCMLSVRMIRPGCLVDDAIAADVDAHRDPRRPSPIPGSRSSPASPSAPARARPPRTSVLSVDVDREIPIGLERRQLEMAVIEPVGPGDRGTDERLGSRCL
jgi:hypothetical protein